MYNISMTQNTLIVSNWKMNLILLMQKKINLQVKKISKKKKKM